jgi:hypothetical protein
MQRTKGRVKRRNRTGESKFSPRRLSAYTRELRALELRLKGLSFREIATKLGYADHTGAYRAVEAGLKKGFEEPAGQVRKLELARLDSIMRPLWPKAKRGGVKAIDRILKIMERRAKLLGLDAPSTFKLTDPMKITLEWKDAPNGNGTTGH